MKKLFWAAGGLAVLAVSGALLAGMLIGPAVKAAVETLGPQVAGVPMSLRSFSISPLTGRVRLRGLVIGNPPGYKTASMLELGDVRVAVSLRSLMSDTIVVKRVLVRGASATYEKGPGGSNTAVVQQRVESFSGPDTAAKADKPAKKLIIRDFRFEDGKVRLSAGILGGKALELPIPDIHLKDIGGDHGTSPAKAAAHMLGSVTGSVGRAVLGAGKAVVGGAVDAAKSAAKAVGGLKKLFK